VPPRLRTIARDYLERIGVPPEKVTFILGSTDDTLPRLEIGKILDFAYVDGCHGYPFPALDSERTIGAREWARFFQAGSF
jgi:hypothetical protein